MWPMVQSAAFFVWLHRVLVEALSISVASCAASLSLQLKNALVVARRLSCPAACGISVPKTGLEPVSPELQGRFFTTGPTTREVPRAQLLS